MNTRNRTLEDQALGQPFLIISDSESDTISSASDNESQQTDLIISERIIVFKPLIKIEYTDYKPAQTRKHMPTYKDLDGGKKNQYCSLCKLYFNRAPGHPKNMHNHIMNEHCTENADGTYSCKICTKLLMTRAAAKKHFDQTHRMFDKPKICHICGAELLFYGSTAKHYASHREKDQINSKDPSNQMSVECTECNIQFTSKAAFYLHRKSFHTSTTKVECDICNKTFRNPPQLKVHKVQAHMEKRFNCEFCEWRCSYKYMIKEHMKKRHPELYMQMDFSDIKRGRVSKDKLLKDKLKNLPSEQLPS